MIIICNNDTMIFVIKLMLFDLKSIISYLMHYNKNKRQQSLSRCDGQSFSKLLSILTFLLCYGKVMSLLSFLSDYFIFFTNLAFLNFYKITCTNIDLPGNFLEISDSGENLAVFFLRRNS